MSFTLYGPAQQHLQTVLPDFVRVLSERGLVPILSHAGAGRTEKEGKVIWEYQRPVFLLAGQKREALGPGKYYDLLGFPVWIAEFDNLVLKGRVLTFMRIGEPKPEEHLVIEDAPQNYLDLAMRENCAPCRELNVMPAI